VQEATPAQLAVLTEILARPEFRAAEGQSLLDRLRAFVQSWINWLVYQVMQWLGWLFGPVSDDGGSVVVLAAVGLGVVIVLAAALLLYRLAGGTVTGDAALAGASLVGLPRAADELARARELAQAGQSRRALHHHYRAVLLRLDERDHLSLDGALTNRELLPRLTAAPELADPFEALVSRFDRLWYGQTNCSPEEYAAFAQLAERVWHAAEMVAPARTNRPGSAPRSVAVGAAGGTA
jgi:hypothetical protein